MRVPKKRKWDTMRIEHPRFLRMQAQPETGDELLEPRPFAVRSVWREQNEVIRVSDESPVQVASRQNEVSRVQRIPVATCRPGDPGGAPRCSG
jgi:hypothetical protein